MGASGGSYLVTWGGAPRYIDHFWGSGAPNPLWGAPRHVGPLGGGHPDIWVLGVGGTQLSASIGWGGTQSLGGAPRCLGPLGGVRPDMWVPWVRQGGHPGTGIPLDAPPPPQAAPPPSSCPGHCRDPQCHQHHRHRHRRLPAQVGAPSSRGGGAPKCPGGHPGVRTDPPWPPLRLVVDDGAVFLTDRWRGDNLDLQRGTASPCVTMCHTCHPVSPHITRVTPQIPSTPPHPSCHPLSPSHPPHCHPLGPLGAPVSLPCPRCHPTCPLLSLGGDDTHTTGVGVPGAHVSPPRLRLRPGCRLLGAAGHHLERQRRGAEPGQLGGRRAERVLGGSWGAEGVCGAESGGP